MYICVIYTHTHTHTHTLHTHTHTHTYIYIYIYIYIYVYVYVLYVYSILISCEENFEQMCGFAEKCAIEHPPLFFLSFSISGTCILISTYNSLNSSSTTSLKSGPWILAGDVFESYFFHYLIEMVQNLCISKLKWDKFQSCLLLLLFMHACMLSSETVQKEIKYMHFGIIPLFLKGNYPYYILRLYGTNSWGK